MAVFSKYLIASSVLSAIALAAPLVRRDVVTDIVTETVWTTLDVTTTIYGDATTAPAVTTPPAVQMTTVKTSTSTPTTPVPMTTSAAPVSSSTPAAEFFNTTPVANVAGGGAARKTSTRTSASASVVSSAAIAHSVTASTSGTCEGEENACVGDVTYWTGGLGACGNYVDTNTELAIALPYAFMGTESNDNPYCGRSVTLYNPTSGTTVQAVVQDKCMGCVNRAIDCTELLFNEITDNLGNGRMSGIEWWLN